jgi:ABC-type transporter Mla MlaB component
MFIAKPSSECGLEPFLLTVRPMQFRADVCDREGVRVIHLSGRLEREQSPELLRLCEQLSQGVQIELDDLVSADAAGLQVLGMLRRRGTELVGASPYVAMQMEFEQSKHQRGLRIGASPTGDLTSTQIHDTTDREER